MRGLVGKARSIQVPLATAPSEATTGHQCEIHLRLSSRSWQPGKLIEDIRNFRHGSEHSKSGFEYSFEQMSHYFQNSSVYTAIDTSSAMHQYLSIDNSSLGAEHVGFLYRYVATLRTHPEVAVKQRAG